MFIKKRKERKSCLVTIFSPEISKHYIHLLSSAYRFWNIHASGKVALIYPFQGVYLHEKSSNSRYFSKMNESETAKMYSTLTTTDRCTPNAGILSYHLGRNCPLYWFNRGLLGFKPIMQPPPL